VQAIINSKGNIYFIFAHFFSILMKEILNVLLNHQEKEAPWHLDLYRALQSYYKYKEYYIPVVIPVVNNP
jgi:hypothetical protein